MLCIACCRRRREVEAELKQEFSLWEALKSLLGELPEQYGASRLLLAAQSCKARRGDCSTARVEIEAPCHATCTQECNTG